MAISFVGTSIGTSNILHAGIQEGDRLLAVVGTNSVSGYSHSTPDGWFLLGTSYQSTDGGSQFASLFTRTAAASDADTEVIFQVDPSGAKNVAAVSAYNGSITTPVVQSFSVLPHSGSSSTTIALEDIDVPEIPATLVSAATKKGGSAEIMFTFPSITNFTQRGKDFATGGGAIAVVIGEGEADAIGLTSAGSWGSDVDSGAATGFLVCLTEGDPPPLKEPVLRRRTASGWFPAIE